VSASVRFTELAREQARTARDWWIANRPAAPRLFNRELRRLVERLPAFPRTGVPYDDPGIAELRRALLRRTRYHVYYVFDESAATVWIIGVWGAVRGQRPILAPPP